MINTNNFFNFLNRNGIKFFSGVPDSILKSTRWNLEKKNGQQHIITANEGSAIASCAGYFLSTGKLSCAYMQNSGLGNAINPFGDVTPPFWINSIMTNSSYSLKLGCIGATT